MTCWIQQDKIYELERILRYRYTYKAFYDPPFSVLRSSMIHYLSKIIVIYDFLVIRFVNG